MEPVHVCALTHLSLFVTPWTVAHQAPLSVGFPRQEHRRGLLFPPPGDLPAGTKHESLLPPALADGFFAPAPADRTSVATLERVRRGIQTSHVLSTLDFKDSI